MVTALQICAGLVVSATLLSAATILALFELGRLATRDGEQRQLDAVDPARIRTDARLGGRRRTIGRAATLALIAVLTTFGGASLTHAEAPPQCRDACSVDLENCRDGCVESGGFDGCEEECGWVYEYCADNCAEPGGDLDV